MPRTVYALLVGIDTYPAPIRRLNGCVNDIQRVQTPLADRTGRAGDRFEPHQLLGDSTTRQAIIDGFRQHLGKAAQDDGALFYYSGHGSQEQSPPEFWHLELDRLDETLVCWDCRQDDRWRTPIPGRPGPAAHPRRVGEDGLPRLRSRYWERQRTQLSRNSCKIARRRSARDDGFPVR